MTPGPLDGGRPFEPTRMQKRGWGVEDWNDGGGRRFWTQERAPFASKAGDDLMVVKARGAVGGGAIVVLAEGCRAIRLDGPDSLAEMTQLWRIRPGVKDSSAWLRFALDPDAQRCHTWKLVEAETACAAEAAGLARPVREALAWHARTLRPLSPAHPNGGGTQRRLVHPFEFDATVLDGRRLLTGPLGLDLDGRIDLSMMLCALEFPLEWIPRPQAA